MSWPWSQLGLPGPSDLSEVRHAYAEKLKTTHPEEDPEGFQRLHAAYQLASRMARQQKRPKRPFPQAEDTSPSHSGYAMREDDIMEIEVPEEEPPQEEQDFDFDELLQGGGERPRRPREKEEEEQDFDFDELLQGGGERPRRPQEKEEEEQDFDFDELLQGGGENIPPPEQTEQDFDFERLFAEGEAERAEARRRRGEERRKAQERARRERFQREQARRNSYEQERRSRFDQEQLQWQNTETVLHTIDMLDHARAEQKAWVKFFQSPLFQQTKGSLDLIFGLEDFVSARNLPQEVRLALFAAYGFENGPSRPELQPLYQMLLPAWQAAKKSKQKERLQNILVVPVTLILLVVGVMILISSWLPAFILLGIIALYGLNKGWLKRKPDSLKRAGNAGKFILWLLAFGCFTYFCVNLNIGLKIPLCVLAVGVAYRVICEVLRLGRQERSARGMPNNKRDERWIVAITAVCLVLGVSMLFMPELQNMLGSSFSEDPRERVCQYMEEDFGIPFQSIYHKTDMERYANVFAPVGDLGKMFLAGPDGKRDKEDGKAGYTTNYPEMMVLWALKDFAKAHDIADVDAMDRVQGLESWETAGVYLLPLSFYGEGEVITQLGELLEALHQEEWYQTASPSFEIVLCSQKMEEGRLVLFQYQPSDGDFDAKAVRELYEASFAHSYCAQLLKECGLDSDEAGKPFAMTNEGFVELKGETCCKLYGVTEDKQVAMEYYVNIDGDTIYCLPGGFWVSGGREEDIQISRPIRRADGKIITLFQSEKP